MQATVHAHIEQKTPELFAGLIVVFFYSLPHWQSDRTWTSQSHTTHVFHHQKYWLAPSCFSLLVTWKENDHGTVTRKLQTEEKGKRGTKNPRISWQSHQCLPDVLHGEDGMFLTKTTDTRSAPNVKLDKHMYIAMFGKIKWLKHWLVQLLGWGL